MRPSKPSSNLTSRLAALLWLVAVPVVAVAALQWVSSSEVHDAVVMESSVDPIDGGLVVADVSWTDGDGIRRVMSFQMTSELAASESVGVAGQGDGVYVVDRARGAGPSGTVLLVTALIGLAFAVVVLATVKGFGYVRGTGNYGEMDSDEVKESHAFYWRH